ncbi:hypothetical protein OAG62_02200 [bacterium]|nr:hypothetical protein [bacterium]
MSTLEQEVRLLQNQVRRQRRWNIALGGVLLLSGCIATTTSQSVPDVIQAKKFEVVNDAGQVIVVMESLFFRGEHYGVVTTQNSMGNTLVELGATSGGTGLVETHNGKGQVLVELGATENGEGLVATKNDTGQSLIRLAASDGGGLVKTQNGKGQTLVELGANMVGTGVVKIQNDKGQALVVITTDQSGNGAVLAQDAAGNIKATLP